MKRFLGLGIAMLLATSCVDDTLTSPAQQLADAAAQPTFRAATAASDIVVMTRNMYIGAPVEPIILEPDPNQIPIRVAEAWATLLATNFPARARAMADEIAHVRPHLIGLQEVSLLRTQTPSDIITQGNLIPNAEDVAFDFLAMLLAELDALGLDYHLGVLIENIDIEVPRFDIGSTDPVPFSDVRLTDYDAILVRGDVETANPDAGNYADAASAATGFLVLRGWTALDAHLNGIWYRFVNTHLEAEDPTIRNKQADELIAMLADETRPVIALGDFNTGPNRPGPAEERAGYSALIGAGYDDLGIAAGSMKQANTCCHDGTLSNMQPTLIQRIDLILGRNLPEGASPRSGGTIARAWLVGSNRGDLSRYGTWPSDHAGVAARLVLPNPGAVVE
jgi:endonuclease/exonuclease/phosphatase family metal-dependent hydrolase